MTTMDWILVALQGLVVIGFIALGVRSGGIGLGLWGGVGTLVLVFLFGLDPGEPPISAILIIIAVISAAAAMEAAGGIDYMVKVASAALQASLTRGSGNSYLNLNTASLDSALAATLRNSLNIQTTVDVPAGTEIAFMLNQPIDFTDAYRLAPTGAR